MNLAVNLPKTGALFAERRGGQQFRGWDEDRNALADIYDAVQAGNHILLMANRDPNKPKPKAPKPYPRPDDNEKKAVKPGSFAAMVVAAAKAQKEREQMDG